MSQTVLLVDDSKTVRQAAEMVCAKGEFRLITAGNEQEAKSQMAQLHPSLMVVDCQMKERSGYDLVRVFREDTETSHIPVIMLSGDQNSYDETQGREVGAVGHLHKPFDYETFMTCIGEILSQVPQEGQMDSIPPSTLPTPAKGEEKELAEAEEKPAQPSHFEINMDESMPPTPIRRQMDSLIQEVSPDEIVSEEAEEEVDADAQEASEQNVAPQAESEPEQEEEDAEVQAVSESDVTTEAQIAEQEETQEAPNEEEIESADVIAEEALDSGLGTHQEAALTHSNLVQAAMDRIPEKELRSMVRATVESVVWEVVPELAETLIKAEIERILSEKTSN